MKRIPRGKVFLTHQLDKRPYRCYDSRKVGNEPPNRQGGLGVFHAKEAA